MNLQPDEFESGELPYDLRNMNFEMLAMPYPVGEAAKPPPPFLLSLTFPSGWRCRLFFLLLLLLTLNSSVTISNHNISVSIILYRVHHWTSLRGSLNFCRETSWGGDLVIK